MPKRQDTYEEWAIQILNKNTLRQLKEKRQKEIAEKGAAVLKAELQRLIKTWSQ